MICRNPKDPGSARGPLHGRGFVDTGLPIFEGRFVMQWFDCRGFADHMLRLVTAAGLWVYSVQSCALSHVSFAQLSDVKF